MGAKLKRGGMRYRRVVRTVVGLSLAGVVSASPADALYSWQGSDYSFDFNSIKQVRMCDGESDGNDTHADYYVVGSGALRQVHTDTGSGDCQDSGVYNNKIYRHRAVEESWGEDPKGPWVYPS